MEINFYLGIFLLYVAPILILLEILCYFLLPKFKIIPHSFHDGLYHPTKRCFLIFYKKIWIERNGYSRWDSYCYHRRLCSYEEAKRVIKIEKLNN